MQRGYRYNRGNHRKEDAPPATHARGTPAETGLQAPRKRAAQDPAGPPADSAAAQSPGFAAALLDGSGVRPPPPAGVAGVTRRARAGGGGR